MNKKQIIGIVLGILVLIASIVLPSPEGLTEIGFRTIGLLLFFLVMLIFESLPVGIICFISLALLPLLGVTKNLASGLVGFSNTMLFFVIASFGLAEAVTSTPIVKRILYSIIKGFGRDVKTCILAIMISGTIVSSMVTDVPTVVVFMGIGAGFLKLFDNESDRRKTARPLMIGIPIAIMLGGIMTPAGSGINILTIGLLSEIAGIQITFIQWMVCAIPIVFVMVPFSWWILIRIFPPAEIDPAQVQNYLDEIAITEGLQPVEKKVLVIGAGMLFFWIMSSFVKSIDVSVVALLGCSLFFMPGINVLSWDQYLKAVSWTSFILIGSVLCIANTLVTNGVSEWFVTHVLPASMSLSIWQGVLFVAVIAFVIMLVVPVAPALIGVLSPVIVSIAYTTGINPALLIITLGLCAGNCYLFPIDTIPLITYTAGYYKMMEMPRATIFMQVTFVVLCTLWLPLGGRLIGLV
ncbi:MAG: solute carrier family 13 (sodium-dependent dicarboxylate transporter), er 2/3/5 [Eubacteriaceae bacterium]|jgi:sodium-dependent dicarboxylate transporter 2/3/5|nr:solute carrier family 13 (sodium-dependent dicarboxylate transporter), er 2/3/5 [Eubacteriaceae bacterium]MDN5307328.1 solute carrier family 13 (sodium-dependent dicarboxylate transporter), er 2/3/5 [Eubacteriaceae bacterium]